MDNDRAYHVGEIAGELIKERIRQVDEEGFTSQDDDGRQDGSLSLGAAAYCVIGTVKNQMARLLWSSGLFDPKMFKPAGRRRNLVKAGAMILAEIESIDRVTKRFGGIDGGG